MKNFQINRLCNGAQNQLLHHPGGRRQAQSRLPEGYGKTISQVCLTPTEAKRDAFPSALPEDWGTGAMFQAPSIYSGTEAEEKSQLSIIRHLAFVIL